MPFCLVRSAPLARCLIGSASSWPKLGSVPTRTLARLEQGEGAPQRRTLAAIRAALEAAGVEFIEAERRRAGCSAAAPVVLTDILNAFITASPVIAAGIFAIAGVLLTNRASGKRLADQLREDRERDENRRLFESRRDIYLDAADTIATAITCIGRLADLGTSTYDIIKPFQDKVGSVAKVHQIASEQTSVQVIEIMKGIGLSITELTVARSLAEDNIAKLADNEDRQKNAVRLRVAYADTCIFETAKIAPHLAKVVAELRNDLHKPSFTVGFELPFELTAWVGLDNFRNAMDVFFGQQNIKPPPMWKRDEPPRPSHVPPRQAKPSPAP